MGVGGGGGGYLKGGGKEGETISYNIPSPFLASAFAKSFTLFSIKFVLIIESDTKHNKSF